MKINNSQPGQMVTVANPDGTVIGLYRFDAGTQLALDALQTFSLPAALHGRQGRLRDRRPG